MPKHGDWFWYQGIRMRWWYMSKINRAAYCESRTGCKGPTLRVERDEIRLQIDNGKGKKRKGSHGKNGQWICKYCADAWGVPRKPVIHHQETLL